jgi:trans-2,3-dihydro-3-hydroxyanthranilate isomerase
MRTFNFYQLDVFTDKTFSGNPLAVFPDAAGLSDDEMQKIANEMNLSETVFVFSSEKALRRLRIFTPRQELPLAGHPVVGTWNLLAQLGVTPQKENGSVEIRHELNLGVLPVEIEFQEQKPSKVTMTQGKFETFAKITDENELKKLAQGLGLNFEDLNHSENLPVQVASTGIKALIVPVRSLDALSRCRINSSLLSEVYLAQKAIGCYVFSFETKEENSKAHARFFAPDDNIPEDAATGSAAGSLSGYLVNYGAIEKGNGREDEDYKFTVEQGDFMNRPSRIFAEVSGEKGNVERVKIGGSSVVVAKGEVFFI